MKNWLLILFAASLLNAFTQMPDHYSVKAYTSLSQSKSLTGSIWTPAKTTRIGPYAYYLSPLKLGFEWFNHNKKEMQEVQLASLYSIRNKGQQYTETFTGFGINYIKTETLIQDFDDFIFTPYMGLMTTMDFKSMSYKTDVAELNNFTGSAFSLGLHLLIDAKITLKKTLEFNVKVPLRLIDLNTTTTNNHNPDLLSSDRKRTDRSLQFLPFNTNIQFGLGWLIL